jgi:hypothetical protein
MALITRQSKGSKLSIAEMDGNLTYLEELAQQGGGGGTPTVISTSIVDSFVEEKATSGVQFQEMIEIVNKTAVFYIKVDLNNPEGDVEEKGWFYSSTASVPTDTNNEGNVDLGPGYTESNFSSATALIQQNSLSDFPLIIDFQNGLVVKISRELSGISESLDPETTYYFRPYIKFVDSVPVAYIFGDVIEYETPAGLGEF